MASNPDAIRAFLAAWMETVDYMLTHKVKTVQIESALNHFDESVMSRQYDLVKGMYGEGTAASTRNCLRP